jgi:hypothetical protein
VTREERRAAEDRLFWLRMALTDVLDRTKPDATAKVRLGDDRFTVRAFRLGRADNGYVVTSGREGLADASQTLDWLANMERFPEWAAARNAVRNAIHEAGRKAH